MNRRTLLRSSFVVGAGALLGTQVAACSVPAAPSSAPPTSGAAIPQSRATPEPTATSGPRALVAYFSRAGENYYYGGRTTLAVGNTEVLAEMISSAVAVDVYRIDAADPYPDSYDATVERNVREQNTEARPSIAGDLPAVSAYDTVLLGSGIWNVRPPMIMRTFVEGVDLSGKTIFPFVTYAVVAWAAPSTTTRDSAPDPRSAKASPCAGKRSETHEEMSKRGCAASDCSRPEGRGAIAGLRRPTGRPSSRAVGCLVRLHGDHIGRVSSRMGYP